MDIIYIISDEEYNIENYKTIYLLFINDNHFVNIFLMESL